MLQQTLPAAAVTAGPTDPRQRELRASTESIPAHSQSSAASLSARSRQAGTPLRPANALPHEPQGNVDSELWSLLDTEERVFFADMAPGAISYAPGRLTTTPPAARGLRLDVRV
ncbi:MAG TPA: hypothetical protein VKZ41_10120 [Gemmatimonadales bacterium]|nr:hypothetical protein [Gemmatimonadales bacterium]